MCTLVGGHTVPARGSAGPERGSAQGLGLVSPDIPTAIRNVQNRTHWLQCAFLPLDAAKSPTLGLKCKTQMLAVGFSIFRRL